MSKNTTRDVRRHHRARMQRRALDIQVRRETYLSLSHENYDPTWIVRNACRTRDNMAVCSCWMCGNPRRVKWFSMKERLTLAEQRSNDDFKQQLEDWYDDPEVLL